MATVGAEGGDHAGEVQRGATGVASVVRGAYDVGIDGIRKGPEAAAHRGRPSHEVTKYGAMTFAEEKWRRRVAIATTMLCLRVENEKEEKLNSLKRQRGRLFVSLLRFCRSTNTTKTTTTR